MISGFVSVEGAASRNVRRADSYRCAPQPHSFDNTQLSVCDRPRVESKVRKLKIYDLELLAKAVVWSPTDCVEQTVQLEKAAQGFPDSMMTAWRHHWQMKFQALPRAVKLHQAQQAMTSSCMRSRKLLCCVPKCSFPIGYMSVYLKCCVPRELDILPKLLEECGKYELLLVFIFGRKTTMKTCSVSSFFVPFHKFLREVL